MSKSDSEAAFAFLCRVHGLPAPEREYRAWPPRRYRIDFAWPDRCIGVEVQGGTFSTGKTAHNWGPGLRRDAEKLNLAQAQGWRLFHATTDMIRDGCPELMKTLAELLKRG